MLTQNVLYSIRKKYKDSKYSGLCFSNVSLSFLNFLGNCSILKHFHNVYNVHCYDQNVIVELCSFVSVLFTSAYRTSIVQDSSVVTW